MSPCLPLERKAAHEPTLEECASTPPGGTCAAKWLPGSAFLAAFLAAYLGAGCGPVEPDAPAHYQCPDCNIVLISFDTLRADHVGAYGYPKRTTPNLDRLAERGTVFRQAVSQSSWTRAAHMSMFTGLHPVEHGIVAVRDREPPPDDMPMLAEALQEAGYATAAFTGGVNVGVRYGFGRGFDEYRSNGRFFRDNMAELELWLDKQSEAPDPAKFFLFVHGYDAHTPYLTDPIDRIALGLAPDLPASSLSTVCRAEGPVERIEPHVDEYDGAVHRGDRYIGKILDRLNQAGLKERTVVIVVSDHGEEFLDHDHCFHLSTLHEEVLRVPLIITGPGIEPRRWEPLVPASVSIAPTIAEIAGIADHPFGEESLAAALIGRDRGKTMVVSETHRDEARTNGQGHLRAVTTGQEKLVHWVTRRSTALYDLDADPHEQRPVRDGSRAALLRAKLDRWLDAHPRRVPATRKPSGSDKSRRDEQQLRALGYLD